MKERRKNLKVAYRNLLLVIHKNLLKNDGDILPIDKSRYHRILVVGENADFCLTKYGGSSGVKARYEVMPIDAIRKIAGNEVKIEYQKGYTSDWPRNTQL